MRVFCLAFCVATTVSTVSYAADKVPNPDQLRLAVQTAVDDARALAAADKRESTKRSTDTLECEIADLRRKLRERSGDRREKIFMREKIKAAEEQIKRAREQQEVVSAAEILSWMSFNPFKLKPRQVGRIRHWSDREGCRYCLLRVIAIAKDAVLVRYWAQTMHYSYSNSPTGPVRQHFKNSYSPPFWLEGVSGTLEESLEIPRTIWHVRRGGDYYRLMPVPHEVYTAAINK